MIVYRVQNKQDGRGPYKPGFSHVWVDKDDDGYPRPPWNEEFGFKLLKMVPDGHAIGCGFRTMEQLRLWFSPRELKKLEKLGYEIVSMDVDEVLAESATQLVFHRKLPLRKGILIVQEV